MTDIVGLDIQDPNELLFKVEIKGAAGGTPAKVRMVCEGSDVSYMFPGRPMKGESDMVQFLIPKMANKVEPGTYSARVEVFVENRYFVPVEFDVEFKDSVSVTCEGVSLIGPEQGTVESLGGIDVTTVGVPVNVTRKKSGTNTISERIEKAERIMSESDVKVDVRDGRAVTEKKDKGSLGNVARSIISKRLPNS